MPRPLIPFALERWFSEFEFVGGMRHLAASGAYSPSVAEVVALDATDQAAHQLLSMPLDYIDSLGTPSLRDALVTTLYPTLTPDQVRITTGASEALVLVLLALTASGDNIIVEEPGYEHVPGMAASLGVEVRRVPLDFAGHWLPDVSAIQRLIDARTHFILLSHPHNPTGSVLAPEALAQIAALADQVGARVVSDEVFRPIALAGSPLPTALETVPDVIVIGDMTKPWGLGGTRIGWVATHDQQLLQQLKDLRDYTTMCSTGPGELLAEWVLRASERVLAPRLANARANLALLRDVVQRHHLIWHEPTAGYSAFIGLPQVADVTAWCRHLATHERVLLVPGSVFGEAYNDFVRIGFGGDAAVFAEGLAIIDVVLGEGTRS